MVTTNDMKFGIKSPWLNPLISSNLYYVRHLTFMMCLDTAYFVETEKLLMKVL